MAPARVDLSHAPREPGAATLTVAVEGQGDRKLALWLPEGSGPHPLVIFLHGAGATEVHLRGMLECLVEPGLAPLHPVIIGPLSSSKGQWWTEADISFVLGVIEAARQRWSIADARPLLVGYSNGGIGAWFFARQYPTSFSAAIPIASNDTIIGPTPLPVYAIHGTKDELFPIEGVRRSIRGLKAEGRNVTLNEKYRGSHMKACSYVPELEAAREWLATGVWTPTGGAAATP